MPATSVILIHRSLETDFRRAFEVIEPGMRVFDVDCGIGTIPQSRLALMQARALCGHGPVPRLERTEGTFRGLHFAVFGIPMVTTF